MTNLAAYDILTDALALVREGWTQNSYHNEDNSCYCAVGALYEASETSLAHMLRGPAEQACKMLANEIQPINPIWTPGAVEKVITVWNDYSGRTKQEVIDLFLRAGARS